MEAESFLDERIFTCSLKFGKCSSIIPCHSPSAGGQSFLPVSDNATRP